MTQNAQDQIASNSLNDARLVARFGPVAVGLAIVVAVVTFAIFAGLTPITPNNGVVQVLFIANALIILILLILVVGEGIYLYRQWRAQAAGAGLHVRIVGLFSVIAATPAILMAIVGSITVERSLNPAYMQDVRGFILNTVKAADLVRQSECGNLLRETRLIALDIDSRRSIFDSNRSFFDEYITSRIKPLNFETAVLMKRSGEIIGRFDAPGAPAALVPEASDFEDAVKDDPTCLISSNGNSFIALNRLTGFPDVFLYVGRAVNQFSVEFPKEAAGLVSLFDAFEAQRGNIQIAFGIMYVLLALIMLLSATWLGLAFANRLVAPIRRLIAATDQVASGNLYVQVPVHRAEGDLAHLGETFNKMTSELRLQQNRLVAASQVMGERRAFTEAVLSGVPAAVIGLGAGGLITVLNPAAQRLVGQEGAIGRPVTQALPELATMIEEARSSHARMVQGQIVMTRAGRERILNVRIAGSETEQNHVVSLDDITDLVTAQRTSAWADVARRIAHEIKNPLTPIQLSAERLKRKYSKVITQDRDIFDQCTDTIVRQVEDIKRMVDEFSSFARMPKPRLQMDDLVACVQQIIFLMRNGNPDIVIEDSLPHDPLILCFDRRLIAQALTNIIKNATEGLATARESGVLTSAPRVHVSLKASDDGMALIEVIDNGIGFPAENRQRLLEPYMTTRAEGTGLGLPIVAKILEDHGGGIELLDAPVGPGARVALYFPIRVLEADSSATPAIATAKAGAPPIQSAE